MAAITWRNVTAQNTNRGQDIAATNQFAGGFKTLADAFNGADKRKIATKEELERSEAMKQAFAIGSMSKDDLAGIDVQGRSGKQLDVINAAIAQRRAGLNQQSNADRRFNLSETNADRSYSLNKLNVDDAIQGRANTFDIAKQRMTNANVNQQQRNSIAQSQLTNSQEKWTYEKERLAADDVQKQNFQEAIGNSISVGENGQVTVDYGKGMGEGSSGATKQALVAMLAEQSAQAAVGKQQQFDNSLKQKELDIKASKDKREANKATAFTEDELDAIDDDLGGNARKMAASFSGSRKKAHIMDALGASTNRNSVLFNSVNADGFALAMQQGAQGLAVTPNLTTAGRTLLAQQDMEQYLADEQEAKRQRQMAKITARKKKAK